MARSTNTERHQSSRIRFTPKNTVNHALIFWQGMNRKGPKEHKETKFCL